MSEKRDVESASPPAYEVPSNDYEHDKIAEGGDALNSVETVEEYGYVTRG